MIKPESPADGVRLLGDVEKLGESEVCQGSGHLVGVVGANWVYPERLEARVGERRVRGGWWVVALRTARP